VIGEIPDNQPEITLQQIQYIAHKINELSKGKRHGAKSQCQHFRNSKKKKKHILNIKKFKLHGITTHKTILHNI
jgi:hypothetical protein